jgi:mannose/cellobiose epimerase-like protein (N-acyl-D-glucosamine 2-epimerase family)
MLISAHFLTQTLRLETWIKDKALPFWSSTGINSTNQSVFERLDDNGQPDLNANMRSRVQSRQILVFCAAQNMGWMDNVLPIVAGIDNFLDSHAKVQNSGEGYAHLLSPDGKIIDPKKDAYDFAFYILACVYRYKTFNDLLALEQAHSLIKYIETEFKAAPGGWMEGDYDAPCRRQNPHMHLFEAFLTCYEFTHDGKWLAKAGQIYTLFETTFYDHQNHVIREFFESDWSVCQNNKGKTIEPGHMFEWIWLLRWYQKLTGAPVDTYCDQLYQKALQLGLSDRTHLVYDEVMLDGSAVHSSKRLWPITELIKASVAQAQSHPQLADLYEEHAAEGIKTLFDFYLTKNVTGYNKQSMGDTALDVYTGGYIDQLDADNKVCAAHAPASTLYHIIMATIVAVNYRRGK